MRKLPIVFFVAVVLAATAAATATAAGGDAVESVSSNWAGYAVADPDTVANGTSLTKLTYTSVTATWTQPKAACTAGQAAYSAFWVGLGGFSNDAAALEQIGTSSDCSATGTPRYSAWYELVPAASTPVSLIVKPGDTITASVNVSGTSVLVQLKDRTRKTSFTRRLTMDSPELSSAEWVAEAPSACTNDGRCHELPLANFGSVTFSKIATIANAHPGTITDTAWQSALIRLVPDAQLGQVVSSTAGATPAAASADGRSFTVNWTGAAA